MKTMLGMKREAERVLAEIAESNPELTEKLGVVREIVSFSAIAQEYEIAVQEHVNACVEAKDSDALMRLACRLERSIQWDGQGGISLVQR